MWPPCLTTTSCDDDNWFIQLLQLQGPSEVQSCLLFIHTKRQFRHFCLECNQSLACDPTRNSHTNLVKGSSSKLVCAQVQPFKPADKAKLVFTKLRHLCLECSQSWLVNQATVWKPCRHDEHCNLAKGSFNQQQAGESPAFQTNWQGKARRRRPVIEWIDNSADASIWCVSWLYQRQREHPNKAHFQSRLFRERNSITISKPSSWMDSIASMHGLSDTCNYYALWFKLVG